MKKQLKDMSTDELKISLIDEILFNGKTQSSEKYVTEICRRTISESVKEFHEKNKPKFRKKAVIK